MPLFLIYISYLNGRMTEYLTNVAIIIIIKKVDARPEIPEDVELDVMVPLLYYLASAEEGGDAGTPLELRLPATSKALLRGFAALPIPSALSAQSSLFEPVRFSLYFSWYHLTEYFTDIILIE